MRLGILTLLILAAFSAWVYFQPMILIWWFNDWKQPGGLSKFGSFTLFNLEYRYLTGSSALLDKDGSKIVGEFMVFRLIFFGLGFGFDYILKRYKNENPDSLPKL